MRGFLLGAHCCCDKGSKFRYIHVSYVNLHSESMMAGDLIDRQHISVPTSLHLHFMCSNLWRWTAQCA